MAFGFIISVYPLVRELPLLGSMSQGTVSYRHFLESALDLVIGIEFIKMLIKHTPGSVIEVLLFALSRHMVLEGGNSLENLLTVCAIAIIFVTRKFLFVETRRLRRTLSQNIQRLTLRQQRSRRITSNRSCF